MEARWLTPNAPEPHKFFTRRLLIPAASDFLGLVNGALFQLCQTHNWEQDGDMTPQETADYFLNLWRQYLQNENEPPTWDTPENVDGQPGQPWYEQLEDWIIQGFLAVTFTPLAALVYQTTVPKLRVAIRTGNIGALFKVLINGIEVWSGDSYSPITDIIDRVFDLSAETEPVTVHVIHYGSGPNVSGESKLEFVRGEAVADMVQTILRGDPGGCGIQWSLDNGGSWNTIDLAYCISTLAAAQIDQYIADGKLAVPTAQQGPDSGPLPGTCQAWNVTLAGNNRWHCPAPVSTGDSIVVSAPLGGWFDGIALHPWYCPTGKAYALGVCGADQAPDVGDPLQTANHMQLVANIGADYGDVLTAWSVPAGHDHEDLFIQANDSDLSDNQGEVTFTVTLCKGGWCRRYTADSDLGTAWVVYFLGQWNGFKWMSTSGSGYQSAWPKLDFAAPTAIHSLYVHGYLAQTGNGGYANVQMRPLGGPAQQDLNPPAGEFSHTFVIDAECTGVSIGVLYSPDGGGQNWIDEIVITGNGTPPDSGVPC